MLISIEVGSHYRNVFNKEKVMVLSIEKSSDKSHSVINYKKEIPIKLFKCALSNERKIDIIGDGKKDQIIIGKIVETKNLLRVPHPFENIISQFNKPKRVFEQTYMI